MQMIRRTRNNHQQAADQIYFKEPVNQINFALTNTACRKMPAYRQTLQHLAESTSLLIQYSPERRSYSIYTPYGVFHCVYKEEDGTFLIVNYSEPNLDNYNHALQDGVNFAPANGIQIEITLKDNYEPPIDTACGLPKYPGGALQIAERMKLQSENSSSEPSDQNGTNELSPELLGMLNLARQYAELSYALEDKKAKESPGVTYFSVESIDYDRLDRVRYRFNVEHYDEDTYPLRSQVDIMDIHERPHSAEIVDFIRDSDDDPVKAVILLFREHIGIHDFISSGKFTLTSSSVNRDVQCNAIERIENQTSDARYMDAVLGRSQPAGFERPDLSALKTDLDAKKYPPNASQQQAIFSGISTKDVFLVMGPPGTGKTTVILEWVKYFTSHGMKVLVSSKNNKAVDNVLARMGEEESVEMLRIGSETKVQEELIPYIFENKLRDLRSKIKDLSDQKRKDIHQVIEAWRQYELTITYLEDEYNNIQDFYNILLQTIRSILVPVYNNLEAAADNYAAISRERLNVRDTVAKNRAIIAILEQKILEYKNQKENENQILTFFKRLFHQETYDDKIQSAFHTIMQTESIIQNQLDREEALYLKALKAAASYKKIRKDYLDTYAGLKSGVYTKYCSLHQQFKDHVMHSNNQASSLPTFLGLFKSIWDTKFTHASMLKNYNQQIMEEISRAQKISAVLRDWAAFAENTQNYELTDVLLDSINLVGATCIGISSQKRFSRLRFDVTIIDEAGQIQIHDALVPMSLSNKLIMLGDHKQIPPMADEELLTLCQENDTSTELLEKSLFEQMYMDLPDTNKIMLDTQYRMPGEIADTISEWFYEGKYYSPDFKRGCASLMPELFSSPYVIIDTSSMRNHEETRIPAGGYQNKLEAEIAVSIIKAFTGLYSLESPDAEPNPKVAPEEIGAISGYKAQALLMRKLLSESSYLAPRANAMAASLDSFQGQERDLIVYSFVRSNPKKKETSRRVGFLSELRRLNVAMTRCKKMLIIIGDMDYLRNCKNEGDGSEAETKTEHHFGNFINKMITDVQSGRGEYMDVDELIRRLRKIRKR